MNYGSVCSGIEAASVAWEPLGWTPAWFAEIEDYPSAVLKHHWPQVTNHGDMTMIKDLIAMELTTAPDVLVGGTPCQAFSVAGARKSLDDDRGQLSLEYVKLLNKIDEVRYEQGKPPAVGVWENVPGVLNTKDNAFGCLLGALSGEDDPLIPPGGRWTDCGFVLGPQRAVAWRVLDAQYFGLAQRRRRVFVVASARADIDPREILFESEGVRRDFAPSRESREEDSYKTGNSAQASSPWPAELAGTIDAQFGAKFGYENQHIDSGTPLFVLDYAAYNQGTNAQYSPSIKESEVSPTLVSKGPPAIAHVIHGTQDPCVQENLAFTQGCNGDSENAVQIYTAEVSPPVSTGAPFSKPGNERVELDAMVVAGQSPITFARVRRLLPVECCLLQGFPRDHACIPYGRTTFEDQICPDSHQYKAYGNSMAVAVMSWLGERIDTYMKGIQS